MLVCCPLFKRTNYTVHLLYVFWWVVGCTAREFQSLFSYVVLSNVNNLIFRHFDSDVFSVFSCCHSAQQSVPATRRAWVHETEVPAFITDAEKRSFNSRQPNSRVSSNSSTWSVFILLNGHTISEVYTWASGHKSPSALCFRREHDGLYSSN